MTGLSTLGAQLGPLIASVTLLAPIIYLTQCFAPLLVAMKESKYADVRSPCSCIDDDMK